MAFPGLEWFNQDSSGKSLLPWSWNILSKRVGQSRNPKNCLCAIWNSNPWLISSTSMQEFPVELLENLIWNLNWNCTDRISLHLSIHLIGVYSSFPHKGLHLQRTLAFSASTLFEYELTHREGGGKALNMCPNKTLKNTRFLFECWSLESYAAVYMLCKMCEMKSITNTRYTL